MPRYEHPVLVEGAVYPGIWQECGPQEGLVEDLERVAAGCLAGALLFKGIGMLCFLVPPLLAIPPLLFTGTDEAPKPA